MPKFNVKELVKKYLPGEEVPIDEPLSDFVDRELSNAYQSGQARRFDQLKKLNNVVAYYKGLGAEV